VPEESRKLQAHTYALDSEICYFKNHCSMASLVNLLPMTYRFPASTRGTNHSEVATQTPVTSYEYVSPYCFTSNVKAVYQKQLRKTTKAEIVRALV